MMNRMISYGAFVILTALWLGFGAALLVNQGMLDDIWQAFGTLPLLLQGLVGILALPVVVGLWIWETSWPVLLRLILVAGLGAATVYTFLPKQAAAQSAGTPKNA